MIVTEMALHILMINNGKIKIFPQNFYIRQSGSSIHGDTLIIDNEFLERFFIHNFIENLDKALSLDASLNYKNQRDVILKSIANWFQTFTVNLYFSKIKVKPYKNIFKKVKLIFNLKKSINIKTLDKYLIIKQNQ